MPAARPAADAGIADPSGFRHAGMPAPVRGRRRFGRINTLGLWTLYLRETRRFIKVYSQTLLAPVMTAALFLAVFTLALAARRGAVDGLPYVAFLAPGVVMMSIIQNSFANTSSSMMVSKVQGNIVDTLMPPLSPGELTFGIAMGGASRGMLVALCAGAVLFPFAGVGLAHPLWAFVFAFLGSLMLALTGLLAGVWADKFDHMAAVTNFVITPLSFLSGTFYRVSDLPAPWAQVSAANPVFYLIDGFRYGTVGRAETNPWLGAGVCLAVCAVLWWGCWRIFTTGYKLKS